MPERNRTRKERRGLTKGSKSGRDNRPVRYHDSFSILPSSNPKKETRCSRSLDSHQKGMALETAGRTLMAGCSMMRLPALRSQHQTTAPTGHSTSAAKQKATKPRVGPTILQRHGLSGLPHSMHTGIGMHAIFPNLATTMLTNPALIKPSQQPKNTSFFLDCKNNNKYKDTKRNPNCVATIITDHCNDSS